MRKHLLHKVFEPQSVAIVGASERPQSVGTQLLDNLIDSGFQGDIYPVNPGYQSLRGLRCYPAISAVDHAIDLVVIVIPAKAIPGVLHECGEAGVGAVIIVSAGFAEVGSRGARCRTKSSTLPAPTVFHWWAPTAWASSAPA